MEWNKAKNLILLLLAAVNLFLLCNLLYLVHKNVTSVRSTMTELSLYLEKQGIALEPDLVPRENPGRKVLVVERDEEQEANAAAALLDTDTLSRDGTGVYSSPAGEADIRFGGYLSVRFTEPVARETLRERLERGGVALRQSDEAKDGGTWRLTFGELPVFNCRLTPDDGENVGEVTGRICVGKVLQTDSDPERDASGLLVSVSRRLSAGGVTEIRGIETGWIAGSVSNVGLRLTPAYRLDTDAGDFYINAVDGTLMVAE